MTNYQGYMTIDLAAVIHNWRQLDRLYENTETAAVVKADAYGLGAKEVGKALFDAGCRTFFVALPEEGTALRATLPEARIFVLNGFDPGRTSLYQEQRLKPVISSMETLEAWSNVPGAINTGAALHVDSGMNRLGLRPEVALGLKSLPNGIELVISHLVDSDRPEQAMNRQQLDFFNRIKCHFPNLPLSLANSFGLLPGPEFAFNLVRPGVALYGVHPPENPHGLKATVTIMAPVLDVKPVSKGETIGYNGTFQARTPMRIATIGLGYADGYMRQASHASGTPVKAYGFFEGVKLPLVGRVSMDLITLDVSGLPEGRLKAGSTIEMLGPNVMLNDVASAFNTIPYEVLTQLRLNRLPRIYRT